MHRRKLPESRRRPPARSGVTRANPAEVLPHGWASNGLMLSERSQAQKAIYLMCVKYPEQVRPQRERELIRGIQGHGGRGLTANGYTFPFVVMKMFWN